MEETYLQIADHWISIISGIFTVILTFIITWLTSRMLTLSKKDKQKTIAINELQLQTKKLEQLFLYQVQPRFTIELRSTDYMNIKNVGGDCQNLIISPIQGTYGRHGNPFENWDSFFSSESAKSINYSTFGDRDYDFTFEDKFGNIMRQTLFTSKRKFSNIEIL